MVLLEKSRETTALNASRTSLPVSYGAVLEGTRKSSSEEEKVGPEGDAEGGIPLPQLTNAGEVLPEDAQEGVKRAAAITQVWSKRSLVVCYIL